MKRLVLLACSFLLMGAFGYGLMRSAKTAVSSGPFIAPTPSVIILTPIVPPPGWTPEPIAGIPTPSGTVKGVVTPTPLPKRQVTKQELIDRARQLSATGQRVDRVEAKLVRRGEYEAGKATLVQETQPGRTWSDDDLIWVVAVSGSLRPSFGKLAVTQDWGVFVYDAATGATLGTLMGVRGPDGAWPPFFDQLPDRSQAQ